VAASSSSAHLATFNGTAYMLSGNAVTVLLPLLRVGKHGNFVVCQAREVKGEEGKEEGVGSCYLSGVVDAPAGE